MTLQVYNRRPVPDPFANGWFDAEFAAIQRALRSIDDAINSGSAGGFVPTLIADGDTFTVPLNKQVLWSIPIQIDGILDVQGAFIMVT